MIHNCMVPYENMIYNSKDINLGTAAFLPTAIVIHPRYIILYNIILSFIIILIIINCLHYISITNIIITYGVFILKRGYIEFKYYACRMNSDFTPPG